MHNYDKEGQVTIMEDKTRVEVEIVCAYESNFSSYFHVQEGTSL